MSAQVASEIDIFLVLSIFSGLGAETRLEEDEDGGERMAGPGVLVIDENIGTESATLSPTSPPASSSIR